MKLIKLATFGSLLVAFSACTPAMALTQKSPAAVNDSSDTTQGNKAQGKKATTDQQPIRRRERCNTCRILM
jgi:hypothetical protein